MSVPIPANEATRLERLREIGILNSPKSPEFDAVVELAANILDCPIALISIVGENEQWFKAKCGLDPDGTSRDVAFCAYTIIGDELLVVEDATSDERFKDNPLVTGDLNIRFYAGCPLSIDGEHNLGTLCIIDTKPRTITDAQRHQLRQLATTVEGLLRAFESNRKAELSTLLADQKEAELHRHASLLEQIVRVSGVGGWQLSFPDRNLVWTEETRRIHEVPEDYVPVLDEAIEFYAPEARPVVQAAIEKATITGEGWDLELPLVTAKGRNIWVRAVGKPVLENEEAVGVIGAFQDISDRKEHEELLKQSESLAKLRTEELVITLGTMNEGVSVFDRDGKLLLWNQRYVDIFNKPDGEVEKGVSLYSLIELEKERGDFSGDVAETVNSLNRKLAAGETVVSQFTLNTGKIISSVHAPMPDGGWVGTHTDITEQVEASKRIEHAALHDTLTGLANRLLFNTEFESALECARSERQDMALMLVDLDRFKHVNDTYGHGVGDALLIEAAERLNQCVRPHDLVARLGGDEFAVLVSDRKLEASNLATVAKRIVSEMLRPFDIEGHRIDIGASIGVAVTSVENGDGETILAQADSALYKVKSEGRSNYRFFDDAISEEMHYKQRRDIAVKDAVQSGDFALIYQPVIGLRDGAIQGYEALIRWDGSAETPLAPRDLIAIAEQNGSIGGMDNWALDTAMSEARGWDHDTWLAVNVSSSNLGQGILQQQVERALSRHGFSADRLELEFSEIAFPKNDEFALEELHALRQSGVRIVLDNFGAESAALNNLHQFPFDRIKIDRAFVQAFEVNHQTSAIVLAAAGLASGLDMETTAVGVETPSQMMLVKAAGCTQAQGFLLGRPVSADKLHPELNQTASIA